MTLKEHLENCGMINVSDVKVIITRNTKKVVFSGCEYNDPRFGNVPRFYLIGNAASLPDKSTSRTTVFYHERQQQCDFILACYSTDSCLVAPYAQFHPFGHNFLLSYVDDSFVESEKSYNKVKYNQLEIVRL